MIISSKFLLKTYNAKVKGEFISVKAKRQLAFNHE